MENKLRNLAAAPIVSLSTEERELMFHILSDGGRKRKNKSQLYKRLNEDHVKFNFGICRRRRITYPYMNVEKKEEEEIRAMEEEERTAYAASLVVPPVWNDAMKTVTYEEVEGGEEGSSPIKKRVEVTEEEPTNIKFFIFCCCCFNTLTLFFQRNKTL